MSLMAISIELYPLQHGFHSKRSCETQLIEFVDNITKNMSAGKQTDILIKDFFKVFDKVSHSLLHVLHKLEHYAGLSIFFKCTSTLSSLSTGDTFS
jgi:hypothetical protein